MKAARSGWVVSFAILLFFFFLRLMTQGSSRRMTSSAPADALPADVGPAAEIVSVDEQPAAMAPASKSGGRNTMARRFTALAVALAMVPSLILAGAGTAFADAVHNSGDKVDQDTIQLNWTGNGSDADFTKCGDQADPGHLGFENGATADDYMLWIFNDDGGSTTGAVTITINGTDYTDSNDSHQIVTPYVDPSTITDAHTNFVVTTGDTGNGAWVLTISHGCVGTVEDLPFAPTGSLGGPCADPAYYAIFDNSATDPSITVKYRMRWYNNYGLNAVTKLVPGGSVWTTYQHWAKPGTYVSVWYKDPNTLVWVRLERQLVAPGSHPPCVYTPGWNDPA